jgi:hypothetical protein
MNVRHPLPVHKKAWFVFSTLLFGLAWLMWIPIQSKPLIYFWELWPALFTATGAREKVFIWLLGSIIIFLVGAVFLGWILQFVWGLFVRAFSLKQDPSAK